ncbi:MAG TPA: thioesterase domain-containing protein [Steroidobacteraceae bacterium]
MPGSKWFLISRPKPLARYRLFCFPYAGGSASAFLSWEDLLPPQIELVGIQAPGRANRLDEGLLTSVVELAEQLAGVIPPMLDRPYLTYGHSMGSAVSFELLHLLKQRGLPLPRRFFGAARQAPHIPRRIAPFYDFPLREFIIELKRFGGTPDAVLENAELMEMLVPMLRTELRAAYAYHRDPEVKLECDVSVFGGARDEIVLQEELSGWQEHFLRRMDFRLFESGHFFLEDNKDQVVRAICESIGLSYSGTSLSAPVRQPTSLPP